MQDIKNLSASIKFKNTPIGEIPVDWGVVKLGDVTEIGAGDSAPQDAKYFENGKYLFIRTSDVGKVGKCHRFGFAEGKVNDLAVKELGLRQWPKGTILFPKSGASTFLNHRVLLSEPAYVSSHLAAIVAKNHSAPEFLYYYLSTIDAKSLVPYTNYPSLRLGDLASIHVPFPPLPEQKKIAEILSTVDEVIEKVDKAIEKTVRLKKGLMQELLTGRLKVVESEESEGSIESGESRSREGQESQLSLRVRGSEEFKNSPIGKIPKEWETKQLAEIAEINRETKDLPKDYSNSRFSYIDIDSVENETGIIKNSKEIMGKEAPSRARRVVHYNNVIMSTVRPYLKAFALVPKEYDGQICSTGFAVLTCKENMFSHYLLYTLFSKIVINQCNKMMVGGQYPALNSQQVSQIVIPVPSVFEQKKIAEILGDVDERLVLLKTKKQKFERIKKQLMNDLLTGKRRVYPVRK